MPMTSGAKDVERLRRYWDKHSRSYDKQMAFFDRRLFGDSRQWICRQAVGDVLEVAVGTGLNLDSYPEDVTITGVETSPDLRHATVFVSVFGGEEERASSLETLAEMRGELQHEIALHLRMKNTPVLKFEYDDSVDRSMRVNALLTNEVKEDGDE